MRRSWWLVVFAIVAAVLLYISFAGRTPGPKPQFQDEFPIEQTAAPT
jgi:hypothetical protein